MMTYEQKKLAEENIRLVYWFIHRRELSVDEYEGMLMETLCRAAIKFDPQKGFKFSSYALLSFSNCIKMHVRNRTATCRVPEHLVQSGEEAVYRNSDGIATTLFDVIADKRDDVEDMLFLETVKEYVESLDKEDRMILCMKIEGMGQRDIAKRVGMSQPNVCRRLKRILEDLERWIMS